MGTWDILQRLASETDHLHVQRTHYAGDSHIHIEQYAGTNTWVFGVDGDELYDPTACGVRRELLAGAYEGVFKVASERCQLRGAQPGARHCHGLSPLLLTFDYEALQ